MRPVGVTGHQVIPQEALPFIEAAIASALRKCTGPIIGVTSLAAGADQIFARLVLEHGGTLNAVIPCERYEDAFASVAARRAYLDLLALAREHEKLPFPFPSEDAFFAAGKRVVDYSGVLIAIWDGQRAKGRGGTAEVVAYARDCGKEVIIVWPPDVER